MRTSPKTSSVTGVFPWDNPEGFRTETYTSVISDDLLESSPHPGWSKATWKEDKGGPFEAVKRQFLTPWHLPATWRDWFGTYVGFACPWEHAPVNGDFPQARSIGDTELRAMGSTAINIVAPTTPRSNLQNFLGELRQGLPRVTGLAHSGSETITNAIGSEYLNYQFGVLPFISDIETIAGTFRSADDLWRQYLAGSGKPRRKRFGFPETIETSVEGPFPVIFGPHPSVGVHYGTWTVLTVLRRKVWFSGLFKYAVPDNSVGRAMSKLHYLYGIGLQGAPATAWELLPFSWLADWVGNTSTILTNTDAFLTDGLVMPYGYIMEETTETKWIQLEHSYDLGPFPPVSYWGLETVRKKRLGASPFGFDIDWPNLSAKQLGILAALGVTRVQR